MLAMRSMGGALMTIQLNVPRREVKTPLATGVESSLVGPGGTALVARIATLELPMWISVAVSVFLLPEATMPARLVRPCGTCRQWETAVPCRL